MKKVSKNSTKFTVPFNKKININNSLEISNLRNLKSTVKTAKNKKPSSILWLQRHLNDYYVKKAKIEGYFSRSAYKLLEINKKFNLIQPSYKIIDLGAAPGGWSQVCSNIVGVNGLVISVDLLDIKTQSNNNIVIKGNFLHQNTLEAIRNILPNKANIILSDMSPNTTGNKKLDHLQILNLIEKVIDFTNQYLELNGSLVIKVFQGGLEPDIFHIIKQRFKKVTYFKPNASRKESREIYLIATHFY